jgi:hypothetical protein
MNDRRTLENYIGREVEIRGQMSPVQDRRNWQDVEYHKQCVGGKGGLVQVIVDDQVVGVIDHINWFTTQIDPRIEDVHRGLEPWDIVRIVGTVRYYPRRNNVCIEDIREIEVL